MTDKELMARHDEDRMVEQYPGILFPDRSGGGYTFFKRVISQNLKTQEPVYFNTGSLVFRYDYNEGDETFMDGATLVEGDEPGVVEILEDINASFDLHRGLSEAREEMRGELKGEQKHPFGKMR